MAKYRFAGVGWVSLITIIFMFGGTASAGYSTAHERFQGSHGAAPGHPESFQMAVTAGPSAVPEVEPPAKASPPKPEKSAEDRKPAKTSKSQPKVKKPEVKKADSKTPKTSAPEQEEPGFLSKTLDKLLGEDEKPENTQKKTGSETEEGFLTKTLKTLVGEDGDEEKDKNAGKSVNPLEIAPTAAATKDKEEAQPVTAKSETKATLKESLNTLMGVDAAREKAKSPDTVAKSEPKEDSGVSSTLKNIIGGEEPKTASTAGKPEKAEEAKAAPVKQVEAKNPEPEVKPVAGNTRKYLGNSDEAQKLEEDRGGVKKGKNILKESFKSIVKKEDESKGAE